MPARNYDRPDPAKLIFNLRRILERQNMKLLERNSYEFIIAHCGFIAHFNHAGFIEEYQDDLPRFVAQFLNHHGFGWETFIDNRGSYLYEVSYKGRMLADIIRELIPIFEKFQPLLEVAHADRQRALDEARLRLLAEKLGYTVVPKHT